MRGLEERTAAHIDTLYNDPAGWTALRPAARTFKAACLAFALLSSIACALGQLAFQALSTVPYSLMRLVSEPSEYIAQTFIDMPKCMLDPFTAKFLKRFNTVPLLLGKHCRAILVCLGMLCRVAIDHIECRHAQIRRLSQKSSTWLNDLMRTSSAFVTMRHRVITHRNELVERRPVGGRKKLNVTRRRRSLGWRRGGGYMHHVRHGPSWKGVSVQTGGARGRLLCWFALHTPMVACDVVTCRPDAQAPCNPAHMCTYRP